MIRQLSILTCLAFLAGSAVGADNAEITAPVRQFGDGVSANDYKLAASGFVDDASVIDDMAPHLWQGKGSTAQWIAALESTMRKSGIKNFTMKVGTPSQLKVNGDVAYAVIPSTFQYSVNGKASGGSTIMTVVLHKNATGWRITAFAIAV